MNTKSSKGLSTEYSPLPQKTFPHKTFKNREQRRLKKYKIDKEIKLNVACTDISFAKKVPTLVSLFSLDSVYVYDIISDSLLTKYPQISDPITAGVLREDGKVVFSGTETGKVVVHDVVNRSVLRKYNGHSLDVNCIDISSSLISFASVSKDCSMNIYEMANKTPLRTYGKAHSDYAKVVRYLSQDTLLTGGYDKVIKLWDTKSNSNIPMMEFNNENICEDILIINNSNYFIATSDNQLVLYDVRKNSSRLNSMIPIQSSISKIIGVNENKRLFVVASGENFVKSIDIEDLSMRSLYSLNLKQKISSFGISNDMTHFCVGFESGDAQIRSQNIPLEDGNEANRLDFDKEEHDLSLLDPSKYAEKAIVKNYKYFNRGQYAKNVEEGDVVVEKGKKKSTLQYDIYLKKFQYKKALDCVLKGGNVEVILAMIEELIDRNALKIALMNRSEDEVENVLNFILWKIRDVKAMNILIYVFDLMMNYYFIVANKSPKIKELFEKIQKEIQNEISFEEDLMGISKEIESITRIYTTLN